MNILLYRSSGPISNNKLVKLGGVRIADEEIVHYEEKGGGVDVMTEEHGGGGFSVAVLDKE